MCILLHVPDSADFPFHYLTPMLAANQDGAGFVYYDRTKDRAIIRRFLTTEPEHGTRGPEHVIPERLAQLNGWRVKQGKVRLDSAWDAWEDPHAQAYSVWLTGGPMRSVAYVDERDVTRALRRIPRGSPLIFHARLCTHGDVSLPNVHPFRIPKSNAILAHNGVISGMGGTTSYTSQTSDAESDTRELVRLLAGMSYSDILRARSLIEHVGDWSRFAVMNGETGSVARLGHWTAHVDGVHYSNLNFLPKVTK